MKIRCAWCSKLLGFKCPFCGEQLRVVNHPDGRGKTLVCDSGISKIYFTDTSRMAVSHGICKLCRFQFSHGVGNHDVDHLSQEDLANLALIDIPEEERGPIGGIANANTPKPSATRKSAARPESEGKP